MAPCTGTELADAGTRSDISHHLFSHLATRMGAGATDITVEKEGSGRPVVVAGDERWGASITHTKGMIGCAVNRVGEIGFDLERAGRIEHPALRKRMLAPGDEPEFLARCSTIQLWTIKEAVLKLHGSGLRVPMNTVALTPVQDNRYKPADITGRDENPAPDVMVKASVEDLTALIYSGRIDAFLIALAWKTT